MPRAGHLGRAKLRESFGDCCKRCGYSKCKRALQFHHVDATEKDTWSRGRGMAASAEIKAYPERFQLLCANCHFEEHERIDRANRLTAPCRHCGTTMHITPSRFNNGHDKFCNRACQRAFYSKDPNDVVTQPLPERFWRRVEKTQTCWLWKGDLIGGYPRITAKRPTGEHTTLGAARVSYELHHGTLRTKQHLTNTCGNRSCVNPDHLRITRLFAR